ALEDPGATPAGADSVLEKPASLDDLTLLFEGIAATAERGNGKILVVEREGGGTRELIASLGDVEVVSAGSPRAALDALVGDDFDCVVLDAKLPRAGAFSFLDRLAAREGLDEVPVVLYHTEPLSSAHEERLAAHTGKVVVAAARAPEQLLGEASAFLGNVMDELTTNGRRTGRLEPLVASFDGRRSLVVDAVIRYVFVL